jgi:hypothetical protein
VLANNATYQLNPVTPINVSTDGNGLLRIALPVDLSLGAPSYNISLTEGSKTFSFDVTPNQRIIRALASISSGDQIKNATSTTGQKVFDDSTNVKEGAFDALATTFKSLPNVLGTLGASAESLGEDIIQAGKDLIVGFVQDVSGAFKSYTSGPSLGDKIAGFFEFVGDLIVSRCDSYGRVRLYADTFFRSPLSKGLSSALRSKSGLFQILSNLLWRWKERS